MRLLLAFLLLAVSAGAASAMDEIVTIESQRPGITERVLISHPAGSSVATLMMFLGGGGANIGDKPNGRYGNNFLARTTPLWTAAGFTVAIIGNPSDHPQLWNFRTGERPAQDIAPVVAYLRKAVPGPLWAVGTSMGTLSAANTAALVQPGGPDGVVLTSTVVAASKQSAETVFSVDFSKIRVPLLETANTGDICNVSSPTYAERIAAAAVNAPKLQVLTFSGGKPPESGPCEALAAHGYFGIEDQVVAAIGDWIKATK